MEKKGSITVFLALILSLLLSICAGSGSENTDFEQYGYWTLFFVWTI